MKISTTLSHYLAKAYFINFLVLLLALLSVVYLFDTVELIRRGSNKGDVSLSLLLQMGLLKLPEVGQTLLPFAILFSAMFTFWQLTKRSELIIFRSSGFSVWQFLTPIITVGVFIGLLQIMIINPIGALLLGKFEQLENLYLKHNSNQVALFEEGFWLRQSWKDGYSIMHAKNIKQNDWVLRDVNVLFFDNEDNFSQRIDAQTARLQGDQWVFEQTLFTKAGQSGEIFESFSMATDLTPKDLEDSFSSPETMSFWRLRGYISTLEGAGFDASRLRVHYHHLLSTPLMFAAMILLAASVSMRPPRFKGAAGLFAIGIFVGFVVFFLSSFLQALGASNQIPVILAAWSPAFISFLLGISVMMNLEDG